MVSSCIAIALRAIQTNILDIIIRIGWTQPFTIRLRRCTKSLQLKRAICIRCVFGVRKLLSKYRFAAISSTRLTWNIISFSSPHILSSCLGFGNRNEASKATTRTKLIIHNKRFGARAYKIIMITTIPTTKRSNNRRWAQEQAERAEK